MTVLVFAPNWLGDAVMALPAVADLRRFAGSGTLVVAARPGIADLFAMAPGIDRVLAIPAARRSGRLAALGASIETAKQASADVAVLLPNSFHAALAARRAGIAERWGYRRQWRGWLLTRAVARPRGRLHQVDAYRHLVAALGLDNGPREPRLEAPPGAIEAAGTLLSAAGWAPGTPLLGLAPGAAYGGAKRWPPERFAETAAGLARSLGTAPVLVGREADRPAARAVAAELDRIGGPGGAVRAIDLVGRTSLRQLAGVMARCTAFVSNDSGAMHLAAALGVPVAAVFGPTDERATAPLGARVRVLTARAWCRPCMLRECPIDHRCMTRIPARDVIGAVEEVV
ncbi:MAG TPA: lipopolysaccharide heptosyltransferase II [Vicinamibacterales bacterium]|nr:lipopolysaccharide heptosyltransferase II [Vicinamibacterales bacterium]HPW21654.1 lipopolysaccharide heptosyltransferase II [Vicinamibacterales bacterium]